MKNGLVTVEGKTFGPDEVVWLDKKHFVRCAFEGCVFGYAATGDFAFSKCDPIRVAGLQLDGLACTVVDVLLLSGIWDLRAFVGTSSTGSLSLEMERPAGTRPS